MKPHPDEMTLEALCAALRAQGMAPTLEGDPQRRIRKVATLEDAGEGDISFLSNPKYEKALQTTRASAVVLGSDAGAPAGLDCIRIADPYAAITVLIVRLHGYRRHRRVPPDSSCTHVHASVELGRDPTIHPGVTIDEDVRIGDNVVIYPGCYVGPRCRIGDDVILYPNVVLYDDTQLGNRVTVHAGSVIGEDGLGYAPVGGKWVKIPQIGSVEIADDVEIGAACTIDRATLGKTVVGRGTKLSNLIAIGHGTRIGADCLFVAQTGLAGSVTVGDHVTMAGQVGVVGHIRIGDNATIGAKAGVINNVPDGETYLGQPAGPSGEMRRRVAYVARLPDVVQRVKALERELAQLRARLDTPVDPAGGE
jgi:UDP-3-O-[3-hydroxymyristoyl] glucosamine N-acyltransferase